jgi:hypothetical protein
MTAERRDGEWLLVSDQSDGSGYTAIALRPPWIAPE